MNNQTDRAQRIKALAFSYEEQPKDFVDRCNLCGEDYFIQIEHQDRYGFPALAFACGRCGLVFLNPRMTAEAYLQFYFNTYRPLVSAYHGRTIDSKTIQAEQRTYAKERAEFMASYMKENVEASLLDIGGSTGVVAQHFAQRFGYLGKVLDPSEKELEEARHLGLATAHGLFEQVDFGSEKFDLVLLCQTIDHLLNIDVTLNKVRQCLRENGLFFVDIVDFRAAYLRNSSIVEAIKIGHPYYLTQESMEAFLMRKGFKILRKGYAADYLHISYLCVLAKTVANFLPSPDSVDRLLREIRTVQNAKKRQVVE